MSTKSDHLNFTSYSTETLILNVNAAPAPEPQAAHSGVWKENGMYRHIKDLAGSRRKFLKIFHVPVLKTILNKDCQARWVEWWDLFSEEAILLMCLHSATLHQS